MYIREDDCLSRWLKVIYIYIYASLRLYSFAQRRFLRGEERARVDGKAKWLSGRSGMLLGGGVMGFWFRYGTGRGELIYAWRISWIDENFTIL